MILVQNILLGWAAASSSWPGRAWKSPYAIARLDIAGYIEEYEYYFDIHSRGHNYNLTSRKISEDQLYHELNIKKAKNSLSVVKNIL